jgi:hypothetical protein
MQNMSRQKIATVLIYKNIKSLPNVSLTKVVWYNMVGFIGAVLFVLLVSGPLVLMPMYFLFQKGKRILAPIMMSVDALFAYWWLSGYTDIMPENESGSVIFGMLLMVPAIALLINIGLILSFNSYNKKRLQRRSDAQ